MNYMSEILERILSQLGDMELVEKLSALPNSDGDFVDWMRKMTNNKRERCLISGIGLDRLLLI